MNNQTVHLLWAKHTDNAEPILVAIYNSREIAEQEQSKYAIRNECYSTAVKSRTVFNRPVL